MSSNMNYYYVGSVLCVFSTIFLTTSGNKILGRFGSGGGSQFGGGASHQSYTNNNGVVTTYEAYGTYEQVKGNECLKRLVEVVNGKKMERVIPMSCDEVQEEIRQQGVQTERDIAEHHRKMNEETDKMMKQHAELTDRINREIQAMHKGFMF